MASPVIMNNFRARRTFAKIAKIIDIPNLIDIQKQSYEKFLQKDIAIEKREDVGLQGVFKSVFPIKDFSETSSLEFVSYTLDKPKYDVDECRQRGMTFAAPIKVTTQLMIYDTREGGDRIVRDIKEQEVYFGELPLMTETGTFIINGTERVVVSQLVRSPGVIFQPGRDAKTIVTGTIHPYRGEWIEFDVESKPGKDVNAGTRVARKRRLSLFVLLRALGYEDEAFLERFVRHFNFLSGQWEREREIIPTRDDALLEIYKRARPGEPLSLESARAYFENAFFSSRRYDLTRVGRYKLNRKLGPEIEKIANLLEIDLERPAPDQGVLSPSEVLAAATYMLHLANGEPGYRLDDQDHFANRRIRSVGELIQNQVRIGLSRMERVVRERMTTQDVEAITPQTLINIRPVVAAIKEFFGTSQLSQFMDQHNPLSGLAHKRRLSALGPGGLSRERAGFEVRDVHTSHYGRMCPIETPEGPNIGLIGHLATYARVNEHGFIETPYRKVTDGRVTDEIVYLAADEEEEYVIAQASAALDRDGHFIGERVLVRRGPQGAGVRVGATTTSYGTTSEVDYVPPAEVDLMDVSPKQIVSVSTALIPFVEHDDANRALMGANMQKQAVPLVVPEAPYIGTGVEARAAQDAGD
ncbi:MAG TPA: DNA-directed RNA polymerase subunit beta, partial [Acidimicrobiales bacterium]|nr:DNA-directed RNA polymerase subunit beta [Acidimicrobiales bacterium]